jgi:hypothetical protein
VVRCVKAKLNGDSFLLPLPVNGCATEQSAVAISGDDLLAWAKAFAFTQLVEAPIYRRFVPTGWGQALGASAITHPIVWFVFPEMGEALGAPYVVTGAGSEVFACVIEAVYLAWITRLRISPRRAALVSLVANGASLSLGLLVRALWGIV